MSVLPLAVQALGFRKALPNQVQILTRRGNATLRFLLEDMQHCKPPPQNELCRLHAMYPLDNPKRSRPRSFRRSLSSAGPQDRVPHAVPRTGLCQCRAAPDVEMSAHPSGSAPAISGAGPGSPSVYMNTYTRIKLPYCRWSSFWSWRSLRTLGWVSSVARRLWQRLQSLLRVLPVFVVWLPSWQRKQPG